MATIEPFPTMTELMAPARKALLSRRPKALQHLTQGRYGAVLAGWSAQGELVRAYLLSELLARRAPFAEGPELLDIAADLFAEVDQSTKAASANIAITREVTNASSATNGLPRGVIRSSHRIVRTGDPAVTPVIPRSEYSTLAVLAFDENDDQTIDNMDGTWTHRQTRSVEGVASQSGPDSNTTLINAWAAPSPNAHHPATVDRTGLFDAASTWTATVHASGGTQGPGDVKIRALIRAMGQGRYGPNELAAIAGALSYPGVIQAAYVSQPTTRVDRLYVVDESWASSAKFRAEVKQRLLDKPWLGFGARVDLYGVQNVGTLVKPTVLLRKADADGDLTDLSQTIRTATRAYFDERAAWYSWTQETLIAAIIASDRRVLSVPALTVEDQDGTTIPEFDDGSTEGLDTLRHPYLVGDVITYTTI